MIKVENLTKYYGATRAVEGLAFEVAKGEVTGLLGPNGAGKTTTMNLLTCYLRPSSGTATVEGFDVRTRPLEVRSRVGYLPEDNPLYEDMDVFEYLSFIAAMRDIPEEKRFPRIKEVAAICGLSAVIAQDIGTLSRGYKQRVGFAQAILHDPDVLILDEPTSGLDPNQAREIRSLITQLKKEKTVILSTHILSEAQAICDRVMIINNGTIVADGTKNDLEKMVRGAERLYVQLEAPPDEVIPALLSLEGVAAARLRDAVDGASGFEIDALPGVDLRRSLFRFAVGRGWTLLEMRREIASLEEIFRTLTAAEPAAEREEAPHA